LIVVGFAPDVAREDAARLIATLGGKPLRYKVAANQFQIAVPPGQEAIFVAHFEQQHGVIFAQQERPPTR
jgi:hypothetical protein